jgi:hypothetical protein
MMEGMAKEKDKKRQRILARQQQQPGPDRPINPNELKVWAKRVTYVSVNPRF